VLGPFGLMIVAAGILMVCLFLTWLVHRREHARSRTEKEPKPLEIIGKTGGFTLLVRDRYLLAIAALMLILNCVNTTGEYVLDRTLVASAGAEAAKQGVSVTRFVGSFKADYFQWVNICGVVLQLFAVSRIIQYIGVRRALFVMPIVSLGGYSVLAFLPQLSLIFIAKVAENSLDYSLQNTCRHALWLFTSREAKYKVKQIADAFVKRAGDVLAAVVVWVGVALGFETVHFIMGNIILVLLWFLVLVFLGREYARRSESGETVETPVPAI
jgi:ATP:ADP antiporter, AAA family